jgi:hypothetical protein
MSLITNLVLKTRRPRFALERASYNILGDAHKIEDLRDMYRAKPMLIVGNGPSLNKTPLDDFQGIPSIGMNKIDMIFGRVAWRPSMIICSNFIVARQHRNVFAESDIPVLLSWKSKLVMPRKTRAVSYFLNGLSRDFSKEPHRVLGSAGTVTYTALQLAWFMGADPVILVGVDHSFVTTGRKNEIQKRTGEDVNHFDPNYFAAGSYWGVPNLDISEIGYLNARTAFESDGRRVFDATVGGKLQIFPKISIDEALSLVKGH